MPPYSRVGRTCHPATFANLGLEPVAKTGRRSAQTPSQSLAGAGSPARICSGPEHHFVILPRILRGIRAGDVFAGHLHKRTVLTNTGVKP